MNPVTLAEREGRLTFFKNGQYKYEPSKEYLEKKAKSFDSERVNKAHDVKILFRKHIWNETNRRLAKIEEHVDKGLVRIQSKRFILK